MKIIIACFLCCLINLCLAQDKLDTLFIYYHNTSILNTPILRQNVIRRLTILPHEANRIDTIIINNKQVQTLDDESEEFSFELLDNDLFINLPILDVAAKLNIVNPNGQIVYTQIVGINNQQLQLNVANLPAGLYVVTIQNETQRWAKNLVIQR